MQSKNDAESAGGLLLQVISGSVWKQDGVNIKQMN